MCGEGCVWDAGVFLSLLPAGLLLSEGISFQPVISLSFSLTRSLARSFNTSGSETAVKSALAEVPVCGRHASAALETLLSWSLSTLREVAGEASV